MTTQTSTWHGEPFPPTPNQRAIPGTLIGGRYELRAAIGNGGMGTVWQAADRLLRRDVAVKEVLLPPGMAVADRTAMYERTMREARAAAALSHPSVVQVYDVVTEGGRPWIVMEMLHARSLADMIIADGPLAPRAVAKIGVALLGALEVAHGAGVLHRDVKPANVLICTDGRCVLTDFGVARLPAESNLTTPGMVLGSPHFISPERAIGGAFGPPSDLFSLGVSLFTAVEGRPPFDKGDPFETMRAVVEEPPIRAIRAGSLAPVLAGLLEKDPSQRWDVPRARGVLRELLAGPLANGAAHHVTDPYAVVPPAPAPPPRLIPPQQGNQIGGRAMLAPGELPTDRRPRRHAAPESDATNPALTSVGMPGAGMPGAGMPGAGMPSHGMSGHGMSGPGMSGPGMSGHGMPGPGMPPPGASNPWLPNGGVPGPGHAQGTKNGALAGLASGARGLLTRFGQLPKGARIGVVGGLAAVVLLATLGAAGMFGGGGAPAAVHSTAPSATSGPAFAVQTVNDGRGFHLEVPAAWARNAPKNSTYFDYIDPADSSRWLRLNIENAGADATKYIQVVAGGFAKDTRKCAAPFKIITQRSDVKLGGRDAAELEYICGDGPKARHGIERATVVNKKAYLVYLSVEDSRFAESKSIFEHAVDSYQLNPAN